MRTEPEPAGGGVAAELAVTRVVDPQHATSAVVSGHLLLTPRIRVARPLRSSAPRDGTNGYLLGDVR